MITKLSLVKGNSISYTLTFTDENGAVRNITGWTVIFSLKKNWQLPDLQASLQKIITSHTNAAAGQTAIELIPADTQNLDPGEYDFDIQALANTGTSGTAGTANEVYTVMRGKMTLDYKVTTGTAGTAGS